jgi:hypothetical protein
VEPMQKTIIEKAKELEEAVYYSSEGHYEDAKRWARIHFLIGIPASLFSAVAGASALAQFDNHNVVAGILAIIVAVLTALATFLNPNERASTYHASGDKFNALKSNINFFYCVQVYLAGDEEDPKTSNQKLAEHLQNFFKQKDDLNASSLPISEMAYKKAKRTIEG